MAALVAGCTTEESVAPATGPITAATPSATDVAETLVPETIDPTVTIPESAETAPVTEPAATTPSTEATMTTSPPPTGRPTSTATEYFVGGDQDGWLFVGRWTGNDWEDPPGADTPPEFTIDDGTDVLVHESDIAPIEGRVAASAEACSDGRNGPEITPNARAPQEPGFGFRSVAFEADWDTRPRPVALVDANVSTYAEAGRAAFEGTDVDPVDGTIEQIIVTDLDGDGDSESLVAFGSSGYSTLLLVDADSNRSLTIARDFATSPAAPTTSEDETSGIAASATYRVLTVADLNGDGLMEVVVHSWVDEEATVTVDTYDGDEITTVLTASC